MSSHVICITSGGGLPVFTRKRGNMENLPFSIIGSLNGVHMFAKSQNLNLLDTITEDYGVAWKEFHESVILISIASGCRVPILNRFLDSVFNAIVLIVGIDEIKSQKNIERLKRELKVCYPIVERLLDSLDCGDSSNKHSSDLVSLVETIMSNENYQIQTVLNSYTECVDSAYCCLLVHGKIAAATENWWSLHPVELKLLALLATIENTSSSKDIPVFLPYKSPSIALRFVTCTLIPDVQVCCLCGPTPSLEEIEQLTAQCFKSMLEPLGSAVQCHPRNFPTNIQLDSGILGMLLINITHGKYMITRNPHQGTGKRTSGSHRLDILRTFFYQAVLNHLINDEEMDGQEKNLETMGKETYWCSEYHKCHAAKIDDNILCVLYNSSIPTHTMRNITQKTVKLLISDKQLCW